VLLLGLSESGLVGGLIGLGGLNPLGVSGSHCNEMDAKRESEDEEKRQKIKTTETKPKGNRKGGLGIKWVRSVSPLN
jgi:hypothetical protein